MRTLPGSLASLLVLLLVSSCGGGGDEPISLTLVGQAPLDGVVSNTGAVNAAGGGPGTGDLDIVPNLCVRQFFTFSLASVPADATVLTAYLRLVQTAVVGAPYSNHGFVVVDHLDYGPALDATDFARVALTFGLGPLSADASLGPRTVDVTAQVQADLAAGRTTSQFRTRFSGAEFDNDGFLDYVTLSDAELSTPGAHAGDEPRLLLTYQP
jgi:hypothetical protein